MTTDAREAVAILRDPATVRGRCHAILAAGEAGHLQHFTVDVGRLPGVVERVLAVTARRYPSGDIVEHGRRLHFAVGGRDRWLETEAALAGREPLARARALIDLVVTSVLLDAGAGDSWGFVEDGVRFARSEGLAVGSWHMFAGGAFSATSGDPWRADAEALVRLDQSSVARFFQVSATNPLVGLGGRTELLRSLGVALRQAPEFFGRSAPRPGNLVDHLVANATDGAVAAKDVLDVILRGLGSIWPGRIALGGVNLGDVWQHPAAGGEGLTGGLVPFHKLSQWLTYSLCAPLRAAGLRVVGLEALTGLAEYRNGGLFVDAGVIVPRRAEITTLAHRPGDTVIVEWRALTVALLDRVADSMRAALGRSAAELPLAQVLEGGSWAAGREIAAERRPSGAPPITIESDGTVF